MNSLAIGEGSLVVRGYYLICKWETPMIFILKPKAGMYGVSLKRWYRRVRAGLTGSSSLPVRWYDRPGVAVPVDSLPAVMNSLYKPNIW